jgi:hypothetical protein
LLGLVAGCGSESDPADGAPPWVVDAGADNGQETVDQRPADVRVADAGAPDLPLTAPAPPWSIADVGAVAAPGRPSAVANIFFLNGGGADIGGVADAFQFVFQRVMGDGEVQAHFSELDNASASAKAGLMVRGGMSPGAPYAALLVTAGKKLSLQRRLVADGQTETKEVAGSGPWLRLARSGNLIIAWTSVDKKDWSEAGRLEVTLPVAVTLGLVAAGPGRAVFHSARVSSVALPWKDSDVGDVAIPGGARTAGDSTELIASGSDIAGPNDQFTFLHQPLTGDGEVSVRVASFTFADPTSKVGVMFRADLASGAPHLSLVLTPLGTQVLKRVAAGEASAQVRSQFGQLPARWLRLVRIGQNLTCLISMDGVRWTAVHAEPVIAGMNPSMPPPPPLPPLNQVGLVVSARNNTRVAIANLDNIVVRSYPPYPADLIDGGAGGPADAAVDGALDVGADAAADAAAPPGS